MNNIIDNIKSKFIRTYPLNNDYNERLERELNLIIDKNFVDYILKICEILELIKDIPHIIRGSSGSSLVCYLLGITDIDPIKEKICFSRFLNEYRSSMPDIDMDFPHNKRDSVFNKIFNKWTNVLRISNHVTYGIKSAVRKALKDMDIKGRIPKEKCNLNYFKEKDKKKELAERVNILKGQLKNYSLHCGGIIFYTDEELINKYKIKDRQILWNKVDVDKKGYFKIDILSNRGLSQLFGIDKKPLLNYDFSDKKTIELLQSGKNIGLTFAESPAMRKVLMTLKPKTVQDIALCLAIIRPGASKSETNKDDNNSKNNLEDNLDNTCETIEDFNDNIVFDDDAIYYIQKILNCSEDKADSIRRLYSKGDNIKIGQFELELYDKDQNLPIDEISNKLINLRKYSFCKSHALSYAYLVWALAYQKANNPNEFWKSTIKNCNSMYRRWVHVREAINNGVEIDGKKELDNITHFYSYGYWIKKDFIDKNMFVNIIDDEKINNKNNKYETDCEFRGLIACSRWYKKYNKKIKKYDLLTFITIGYQNNVYIDLIVKNWIGLKNKNICSGKGKLILDNGYASIKTNEFYLK